MSGRLFCRVARAGRISPTRKGYEGFADVVKQCGKFPCSCGGALMRASRNKDVIVTRQAKFRQQGARGFAEAALGPITGDRIADFLGRGEPLTRWGGVFWYAGAHLHNHGAFGGKKTVPHKQKLGPLSERPEFFCFICHSGHYRVKRGLCGQILSREALTALGTTASQNGAAVFRRHTGTETMTAGADEVGWLECAFHRKISLIKGSDGQTCISRAAR
jgi:hypothetical protein